jgi:hypothetical protein
MAEGSRRTSTLLAIQASGRRRLILMLRLENSQRLKAQTDSATRSRRWKEVVDDITHIPSRALELKALDGFHSAVLMALDGFHSAVLMAPIDLMRSEYSVCMAEFLDIVTHQTPSHVR